MAKKWYDVEEDITAIQKRNKKISDITDSLLGKKPPQVPKKAQRTPVKPQPQIKKK